MLGILHVPVPAAAGAAKPATATTGAMLAACATGKHYPEVRIE
jgi:hypothetical protein